jgi:hypothetical protein
MHCELRRNTTHLWNMHYSLRRNSTLLCNIYYWLPYGRNTAHITHYAETLLTFKNWIAHIVTAGENTPHLWNIHYSLNRSTTLLCNMHYSLKSETLLTFEIWLNHCAETLPTLEIYITFYADTLLSFATFKYKDKKLWCTWQPYVCRVRIGYW